MSETGQPGRQLGLRLQSALVLPLARGLYLAVALGCLLAVFGGVLYLVYLQTTIAGQPRTLPVPPAYDGGGVSAPSSERVVDLARVGARLDPPANIRFAVSTGTLTEPPREGVVIGRFLADTPNGLAPFPDGVSLIGGRDAGLFERVSDGREKTVALAARPALVAEITESLKDLTEQTRRSFEVRAVARDAYGNVSPPTDLTFDLVLAPKRPAPAASAPAPEPEAEASELQKIAREIARTVEPEVNPAHFAVYKTALAVPERCGSSEGDETFLANYRRAVDEMRRASRRKTSRPSTPVSVMPGARSSPARTPRSRTGARSGRPTGRQPRRCAGGPWRRTSRGCRRTRPRSSRPRRARPWPCR